MSNFSAPLDIRSLPDGRIALLRNLIWYSTIDETRRIIVPVGFQCDGSSIPRLFWPLVGHPLSSGVVRAGAVHDRAYSVHRYEQRRMTRREADREFKAALQVDGVGTIRRWAMWAAVRAFGWFAWTSPKRDRIDHTIAAEVNTVRLALEEFTD